MFWYQKETNGISLTRHTSIMIVTEKHKGNINLYAENTSTDFDARGALPS